MLRNRFLILVGGCLLAASAAWADDVGYIDCSSHSDDIQVFAKARKSPEVVASLPCGERFTILIYGFVFSRIQTSDGKVGYVYSNLISVDRNAASVLQPASERTKIYRPKNPETTASAVQSKPAPEQSTAAQMAATQPPPTQTVSTPAVSAQASVATSSASTSGAPETSLTVAQPTPSAPTQPQPVPAQPASTQTTPTQTISTQAASAQAVSTPASVSTPNVSETTTTVAQPAAQPAANPSAQPEPAPAQPQPAPVQPATPAVRPADARSSWERPIPSVRRAPLLELFGGYAFARLDSGGGTTTNLNGGMGSIGWNFKPWLQIVGDSSYNTVTTAGTKNVLYGNHYGARYFHRGHNRWGITPFAEALVGGSRADTIVSGSSGYTTSVNCLSYKVGGGVDIRPSRRFEIRLFDVDYYRTSFGTNLHQTNYWASTGIVIRLFGGGGAE